MISALGGSREDERMTRRPPPARLRGRARRGRRHATPSCAPGRGRRRSPWRCAPHPASTSASCSTSARPASSRSAWPARAAGPWSLLATSGTAAVELRAGRRRGVPVARPARRADRRPAAGAARPGRAPDHRPGPPLRRARQVVRGAAAVRRRPGHQAHVRSVAGRAVATAVAAARRPGPAQRPVPRAAAPRRPRSARRRADGDAATPRRRSRAPSPGRPILDDDLLAELAGAPRPDGARASSWPGRTTTRRCRTALAGLAAATGFPILADPLSGLRTGAP